VKIGTATQRDETVHARAEVAGVEHDWSYTGGELSLDRAADALLIASLLPAMRSAEPLVSVDPVSPRLLRSLDTVQDVFRAFRTGNTGYDVYKRVVVEAEPRSVPPLAEGRGVASFFTAGVDSFYTALRHRDEIDALVYVRGFDVALDDARLEPIVLEGVRSAAAELELPLVVVSTDLRAFSDRYARWDHYHGAALASVAHLLASHYATVYVPATMSYAHLAPLGSHPLLDPFWSSEDVELVHDGCEATRLDKLSLVASEAAARHWLRVCWENRGGRYNCGRCEKCLRTMVAMDALGVLDAFDCFPHEISSIDIARVHLPEMAYTWEASLELLESTGRDPVIARALRRRLYGPTTRALHLATYYAHRIRALARS
jgi:hypothetical protein